MNVMIVIIYSLELRGVEEEAGGGRKVGREANVRKQCGSSVKY